jgi:2-methylisocitrate lyase-like PEP mutase family enzyme
LSTPINDLPTFLGPDPDRFVSARAELAARIRAREPLVLPGVSDPLSARLAERAGFKGCYATGAGIANVQYGIPDIGLIGFDEVIAVVRRITESVPLPLVVDADTGFGATLSVMRTVHLLERAGAAAVQIEDQSMPKRCGHFGLHELVDTREMVAKIRAAVAARADPNLLIIGRTDALGVLGIDEAIRRGHAYHEAGADVLFIEAPHSVRQLEQIGSEFAGIPLVANVVEGGLTPQLSASELSDLGFSIALFANFLMRVMAKAGQSALEALYASGDSRPFSETMLSWVQRQELVGLEQFQALEDYFESPVPDEALGQAAAE